MSYVISMKKVAIAVLVLGLAAVPAQAEESSLSLIEEGAKMFFKGILQGIEPAMKDLQGLVDEMQPQMRRFVEEMGPALGQLLSQIDDISAYHPPEMLPNGDIILRKKTPEETKPPKAGEIEL